MKEMAVTLIQWACAGLIILALLATAIMAILAGLAAFTVSQVVPKSVVTNRRVL